MLLAGIVAFVTCDVMSPVTVDVVLAVVTVAVANAVVEPPRY